MITEQTNEEEKAMFEIFFDGACNPNPGKGGAGVYLPEYNLGIAVGLCSDVTNNYAEWAALNIGLAEALRLNVKQISIIGDSQLVIKCASGIWQTHKPHLIELKSESTRLLRQFEQSEFKWVPRAENKIADAISNKGLELPEGKIERFSDYRKSTALVKSSKRKRKSGRQVFVVQNSDGTIVGLFTQEREACKAAASQRLNVNKFVLN